MYLFCISCKYIVAIIKVPTLVCIVYMGEKAAGKKQMLYFGTQP